MNLAPCCFLLIQQCPVFFFFPPCVCLCYQLSQGNVPGIESASLAMDTEEGVEVVWNEVQFSDKKVFKSHEVSRCPSILLL